MAPVMYLRTVLEVHGKIRRPMYFAHGKIRRPFMRKFLVDGFRHQIRPRSFLAVPSYAGIDKIEIGFTIGGIDIFPVIVQDITHK
jgi:hypothetical protein